MNEELTQCRSTDQESRSRCAYQDGHLGEHRFRNKGEGDISQEIRVKVRGDAAERKLAAHSALHGFCVLCGWASRRDPETHAPGCLGERGLSDYLAHIPTSGHESAAHLASFSQPE